MTKKTISPDGSTLASFIGNGAIGSLVAASCKRLNLPCDMWWRSYSRQSLTVEFLDGHKEQLAATRPHATDLLVIATKAWQVKDAIRQYKHWLSPNACVILLHNGSGTEEWALSALPVQSILRMTTSKAALKQSPQLVTETGNGTTQAGWLRKPNANQQKALEHWCNLLLPPCQWFEDIQQPIWQKLAVNSVINPLTAIYNIKNGRLLAAQYRGQIEHLIAEFLQICEASKVAVDGQQIHDLVWSVIEKTADNYSSMQQDVAMQRPTEIDYINGFLVTKGKEAGIDVPLNRQMVSQIKKLSG